ncbi:MAG: acyltransferase family protein [Ruminococcus sp.]|nr:acyltransferase family protein [Ruminococcus sp.]
MGKTQRLENRNSTLDIVRIASVLLVMMVHFFLYTGFYSEPMIGGKMFLMCFMRTFFSTCVPMFLILSGYLMSKKTVSKKHYFGISKTLITYVVAGIACVVYKAIHYKTQFEFKSLILSFFDFTAAQYAWYVEMYIGLFLLVPFLNLIYNNLKTKRHKQLLVLTMIVLTALPSLLNTYNLLDPSFWTKPSAAESFNAIFPDWWMGFYPVTFYFTGCYLKEFGLELKTKTLAFLLFITTLGFAAYNFWRSYGTGFITSQYAYWYGFQPYVSTVLLFELLTRIKCDKFSAPVRLTLWKISDLVLSMYLVSYIFDSYIYAKLCARVPVMQDRINYFLPCVLLVFVCSLALAFLLSYVELFIKEAYSVIARFIRELNAKDKQSVVDLCFMIMMMGAVALSMWKLTLGFGGNDEAFYLTVAHRLGLSDTLFADEWNLSQMMGFLLMPFVWLYRLIVGSTEGIMLTFRVLYLIMHGLVAVFAYKRLRKYGYVAAIGITLYFIFTPYNIMALSYNTMALDLLLLCTLLLSTSSKNWQFAVAGLCLAGAVLCNPYLAVIYLLYALCVILNIVLRKCGVKNLAVNSEVFSLKRFLIFSIGVVALALVFFIFIICTCGIKAIFDNLPLMLSDPEHPQVGFVAKFKSYFNAIFNCHNRFKIVLYTYLATVLMMALDRNRKNHRAFYLIVSSICTVVTLFMFYPTLTTHSYNAIMVPMIFIGITSYILCEQKPKELFLTLFATGIIYSICAAISSNQYFYIISMALSISNIASYIFLAQLLKEMKQRPDEISYSNGLRKLTVIVVAFTISLLACMQLESKIEHCFWESPKEMLTEKITSGPAKGLYTTQQNQALYESISKDLESYDSVKEGDILILSERTWCYLKTNDKPYGSFSAWMSGENETALSRLKLYYQVNPDKVPEYIYIPKANKLDTAQLSSIAQSHGYEAVENDVSYKLFRN